MKRRAKTHFCLGIPLVEPSNLRDLNHFSNCAQIHQGMQIKIQRPQEMTTILKFSKKCKDCKLLSTFISWLYSRCMPTIVKYYLIFAIILKLKLRTEFHFINLVYIYTLTYIYNPGQPYSACIFYFIHNMLSFSRPHEKYTPFVEVSFCTLM